MAIAQFAPVVPIQIAEMLKAANVLGNYHLLLAHEVVKAPNRFKAVYGDISPRTMIMDNSLIELGLPVPESVMSDAVDAVKANIIVYPDKLQDSQETIIAIMKSKYNTGKVRYNSWMGVVQGKTQLDIFYCIDFIAKMHVPDAPKKFYMAVPRIITNMVGSRQKTIEYIEKKLPDTRIHLLGFSDDIEDDVACCRAFENVIGMDSTEPIRAALNGKRFLESGSGPMPPRGDYWKTDTGKITDIQWGLILENLNIIREIIR